MFNGVACIDFTSSLELFLNQIICSNDSANYKEIDVEEKIPDIQCPT